MNEVVNAPEVGETKAPKAPKAAAAPKPEKAAKVEANGIVRPNVDTSTGKIWAIADQLSAKANAPADRKSVIDAALEAGINASTASTQYGRWRKFHGLSAKTESAAA